MFLRIVLNADHLRVSRQFNDIFAKSHVLQSEEVRRMDQPILCSTVVLRASRNVIRSINSCIGFSWWKTFVQNTLKKKKTSFSNMSHLRLINRFVFISSLFLCASPSPDRPNNDDTRNLEIDFKLKNTQTSVESP